jgi:hypothetical protein
MHRRFLTDIAGLAMVLSIAGCGGSGGDHAGLGDGAVSDASGDPDSADSAAGSGDSEGGAAHDGADQDSGAGESCWSPPEPGALACADLCEKVAACGERDADCEADCADFAAFLAPAAATKMAACIEDAPCSGGPFAFTLLGCAAGLATDPTYTTPPGNAETCEALLARANACGAAGEDISGLQIFCDSLAYAVQGTVLERAANCPQAACSELSTCINQTSCLFADLFGGATSSACESEADQALLGDDLTPITTQALQCAADCDNPEGCVLPCLRDAVALSEGCAGCFAAAAECAAQSCASACLVSPPLPECSACIQGACAEAFGPCSGVFSPLLPLSDTCALQADQDALASAAVLESLLYCADTCLNDAACGAQCFESRADVSAACSPCSGAFSLCALPCEGTCAGGATAACLSCLEPLTCLGTFETCAGITVPPAEGFACTLSADRAKVEAGGLVGAALQCSDSCGDAECTAACLSEDAALGAACATCYAGLATCIGERCLGPCEDDPSGVDCAICLNSTPCLADFANCAGVAPYELPSLGTATCAQATACALDCPAQDTGCVTQCVYSASPEALAQSKVVAPCAFGCADDPLCLATACWSDYAACTGAGGDLTCAELQSCFDECGEDDCKQDCLRKPKNLEQLLDFKAVIDCVKANCTDERDPEKLDPFCVGPALQPGGECGAEQAACIEE